MSAESAASRHPEVDVVVATHQRPQLLRAALAAVAAQDYAGVVRTWVVFDRSAVDPAVLSDDPQRPVHGLTNTRTPGLAGARNSGIVAGSAPLVAFCDDDDEWLPSKLSAQVAALARSEALTSVTGILVEYGDRQVARVPTAAEMNLHTLVRDRVMAAHPSSVLVRRAALTGEIGLVDEEIPGSHGEDYDWIIRAARAGGFAVVEEPLVRVRWGGSQFSQKWPTIVAATDYWLAKHPEFADDPRALGRLLGQRAFALAATHDPAARSALLAALRVRPAEKRTWLAGAVWLRLISAARVMDLAHRRGRGI